MARKLITVPAAQILTLEEAKLHLRVDHSLDDELINGLIDAVTQYLDAGTGWLGRALVTQTWELQIDAFPAGAIELPYPPLRSVDSVKYVDALGAEQTLDPSAYLVDLPRNTPGRLVPGSDGWPVTQSVMNAVKVRFEAGYGDAAAVPAGIKAGMKLWIGHLYDNRAAISDMPSGVDAMLTPYRVSALGHKAAS